MASDIDPLRPELVALLRCPVTKLKLTPAPHAVLAKLADAPPAALLREDGAVIYPIRDGLPMLVPDAAIPLR